MPVLNKPFSSVIFLLSIMCLSLFSLQAQAGGTVIIINNGYDRPHHYSDYGQSHRLRNKHFFESRYRKTYNNDLYGKRYYRNRFYNNNYRYINRNYYRTNRSYCPNY